MFLLNTNMNENSKYCTVQYPLSILVESLAVMCQHCLITRIELVICLTLLKSIVMLLRHLNNIY